ncbi:cobalt ABC transporter ATP-binding protein [Candidatus Epulonipiscioides gigas]|nr:cobalt ABC transporter ATP-binding protein [Epulopiscium sp. SCG-C07WGA-EpuloA2]
MMNKLNVNNLHFGYTKDEEILKGITLELNTTPTAIIGQNGAGKTTFVKLLKGLLRPSKGDIIFNGQNIVHISVATLAKDIGLIFQNPNDQIFKNTVIDEIMFGPLQIGMDKKEAQSSAENALKMIKLENTSKINPYDLSLSDRKLISIASIIAMNPKVIIFDEPTIAQDYEGKKLIKNIINFLSEQGKIVISILHDMDFVAECFERVIIFSKGNVILDNTAKQVFSKKEILENIYLEQPYITQLGYELEFHNICLNIDDILAQAYKG